jgi:SAM-dependent MidA family methyltransferase
MSRLILPEPPGELKRLSKALSARIREEIDREGMIPFARFMDRALYEPGLGYYSAGLHKFGESGDFVTSPELGPLFAACLARQVRESGTALGSYEVLEIGAGGGRLAAGLLSSLAQETGPVRYRILERSADLKEVQRDCLARETPGSLNLVEWIDEPPEDDWEGVLIANEVLDALAVERFRLEDGDIRQLCVGVGEDGFCWDSRQAPSELADAVAGLEAVLGDGYLQRLGRRGYQSEINPLLSPWLQAVTRSMRRGLALFVDYGYPRSEYYLPERRDGTLMCHYRHRAHEDVFFWPGLQDLTAWVDFTALAEAADACGLDVEGYCSQAMFLLGCGLEQVLAEGAAISDETAAERAAEARQLTLPGMMGERFQVMGLGRGLDRPLSGFGLQDLRHRLDAPGR